MGSMFDSYNLVSEKCGKGGSIICNVIGIILPIAMISVGAIHIDDCPAQKYICIYLIVAGAFAILVTGVRCLGSMCSTSDSGTPPLPFLVVNGILGLFLFSWFIAVILFQATCGSTACTASTIRQTKRLTTTVKNSFTSLHFGSSRQATSCSEF
ncbi:uncharacterized protein [Haliotis asinina]|uniref:uncharacterized protein isoform X2 n=1 Tax=Haliotis asinina TaxID=109174 RepID=UPI00353237F0